MLIAKFSSQAHELMLQFHLVLLGHVCELRPQLVEAQRLSTLVLQGSGEGTSALGELKTRDRGVQVRPSTGCGATRIGYDGRHCVRAGRVLSECHA